MKKTESSGFSQLEQRFDFQKASQGKSVRIGLVQLATDYVLENDWRRLAASHFELYTSRMFSTPEMSLQALSELENHIESAAELLVPGMDLDVLAFGCTSASMLIGERRVAEQFAKSRPGVPCTNPWVAATAALKHLGARNIAVLSPYCQEVNLVLYQRLEESGFTVPAFGAFHLALDTEVPGIDPLSFASPIQELLSGSQADAVFLSCTNLRAMEVLDELEQRFNVPVISSNQALLWHALRLAGSELELGGFGSLLAGKQSICYPL